MLNWNTYLTVKSKSAVFYVVVISLLFPTFPSVLPGYSGFYFALAMSLLLIVLHKYIWNVQYKSNGTSAYSVIYFALFLIVLIVSLIRDVIGSHALFSDLFELSRPIYIAAFYYFFRLSSLSAIDIAESYRRSVLFCSIFFAFFAIFEVFGGGAGKYVSFLLYKREYKEIISDKAVGSFGITYHFAYFMLISTFYYLLSYLREGRVGHFAFFLLCLLSILLAQSRTLYLTVILGFFSLFFCGFIYRDASWRRWYAFNVLFAVFATLVILLYWEEVTTTFSYAYIGLSALLKNGVDLSGEGGGSANLRFNQFIWVIENGDSIPLIGSGIDADGVLLESLYSLYLYRYGLIFLILFFILVCKLIITSYRLGGYYRLKNNNLSTLFYSLFLFYLLTPVALLSSASHDVPRLALIFYGGAGLIFLNKYKINDTQSH